MLDKIWFHKTASAVIDADRCVGCGACIAACPSKSIGIGSDGLPTLVRMCTGCSACWDYCPMAGFRPEKLNHQNPEDPVGPGPGGGLGPRARAARRRAGRRRRDHAARHPDGARRDRRGDPDAEARRVHRHPGARHDRRAGPHRRRQRLPPVRDALDPERALPRGRRADRPGRHAVPDQRSARDPEVPVGEPRHAGDEGDACDRAVLHAVLRPEEAAADGGGRGRARCRTSRRSTSARAS